MPSEESYLLNIYYEESSKYPLLSRKEEVELFERMLKWSKNKKRCSTIARKKGKEAKETLINSNLRLVIKIAKDFNSLGLELQDLISEGNLGLVKAVENFKPNVGAKFSTYAAFWIKQKIRRALSNQGRTIRIPTGSIQQKLNIIKFKEQYKEKYDCYPSIKEISKKVGVSVDRVKLLNESSLQIPSLNSLISDPEGDEKELMDIIEDKSNQPPDEAYVYKNNSKVLYECLSKLSSRERYIISKRQALDCDKRQTLESIGDKFGVTRERIRQIETIAMAKLKDLVCQRMK
jgi:RNA polymerase primary sigma factor